MAGRRVHDDVRHFTTTLFAALDVATGAVIGKCFGRHGATGLLSFLEEVEAAVPEGPDVHLVMDNRATHETEKVRAWLARRRHRHVRFTPSAASWIDQARRRLAELTRKKPRRGVHLPVAEPGADIMSFIDAPGGKPKPCRWVRSADGILASVRRFCLRMNEPGASEEV